MGIRRRLGRAARQARKAAGLELLDLQASTGLSEGQLSRFERGEAWPRDFERVARGYEAECGLGRDDLWRAALDMEDTDQEG